MLPRHRPRTLTGFLGVRRQYSGHFTAEITVDNLCWWLGTFVSLELDVRMWTFGWPHADMNLTLVESLKKDEFLSLPVSMVTREQENQNHRAFLQIRAHEADEEAMANIHRDHPELVQFGTRYFTEREKPKNKKE
jgi:hypothetical protein